MTDSALLNLILMVLKNHKGTMENLSKSMPSPYMEGQIDGLAAAIMMVENLVTEHRRQSPTGKG